MAWAADPGTAVAVYPYDSILPSQLKLISGDVIDIMERCGPWALAKCRSTSCVGICPATHFIMSDGKDNSTSFDLLTFEASCLFSHVFTKYLSPRSSYPNERDGGREHKVLDLVRKVQERMPPSTPDSRVQISRSLDAIRQELRIPFVPRSSDSNLIRAHDIKAQLFVPMQEATAMRSDTMTVSGGSVYPTTISLHVGISFPFRSDVRICPRIVCLRNGQIEVVSAPADRSRRGR